MTLTVLFEHFTSGPEVEDEQLHLALDLSLLHFSHCSYEACSSSKVLFHMQIFEGLPMTHSP